MKLQITKKSMGAIYCNMTVTSQVAWFNINAGVLPLGGRNKTGNARIYGKKTSIFVLVNWEYLHEHQNEPIIDLTHLELGCGCIMQCLLHQLPMTIGMLIKLKLDICFQKIHAFNLAIILRESNGNIDDVEKIRKQNHFNRKLT